MAISSTRPHALPDLRRVLVVGSGGREHALSWALQRDNAIETVGITPGNAGSDQQALAIGETDSTALIAHCQKQSVDLFIATLKDLARAAKSNDKDRFTGAPYMSPRRRLDETGAARKPVLRWAPPAAAQAAE